MAIFGFIGTGNMGSALARAVRRKLPQGQILLSNRTSSKADNLAAELGCRSVMNQTVAERADYVFLGAKPQMMPALLMDLASTFMRRRSRFVIVTMAAGMTIAEISKLSGGDYQIIRIMPNMPVAIGEGEILYSVGPHVSKIEENGFLDGLSEAGQLTAIPEYLIDAGSAITSCGPAYVDMILEAMADGGVNCGLPRDTALRLAAQTVMGTAKYMLESGQHPGVMKDAICSPGGSTIQGLRLLEQRALRSAMMDAVIVGCEKNRELGEKETTPMNFH